MNTSFYIHTFDSLFALFKEWCKQNKRDREYATLLFFDDQSGVLRDGEDLNVYTFGNIDQLYSYFVCEIED